MASIHSPFRYAGGKYYARDLILEHIPEHKDYIEPFAGGASIFFSKELAPGLNWLNDIDDDLINTMVVIRDEPNELINLLRHRQNDRLPVELVKAVKIGEPIPALKELHHFFKYEYHPQNNLERAFRWFYLNRTSYSGIMNFQNMYWGYGDKYSMTPKNWPRNILTTSDKLQGVRLTSMDFELVVEQAPDNSLLYLDPPYYNADQDKFYEHFFSHEDHLRLERCLREHHERLKLFISYDNVEDVKNLYHWAQEMHEKEWNYCIQRTDDQKNRTDAKGQRHKGKELFILDY